MAGRWRLTLVRWAQTVAGPLMVLALWELLSRTGVLEPRFFPPPSEVARTMGRMLASGELLEDTWVSVARVVGGFVLGSVPAVALGMMMGMWQPLRLLLMPVASAIYPVPKIAVLPLTVIIFGLGETSKVVLVAISVFFLVLLNTVTGVLNTERTYFDVGRNLGASRWQLLATVAFPGALPMIFAGLKLAMGFALIVIVGTEFLAARNGVGELIWRSYQTFDIKSMYVGLLVTALLGWLFIIIFDMLERWVIRWKPLA